MAHDKRSVIVIAHSNPVEGANLAKQVEDYFYSTYRVQTVSTKSDVIGISWSLHDSSGPNVVAALVDERLDNGLEQDFLRDANAVLPDEGRLLTQQPAAKHDDGIQRITLSSDGAATFNEELQRALEHTLYNAALPLRPTVTVKGERKKREVITLMRFLRLNSVPYKQEEFTPTLPTKVVVILPDQELKDPTLIELSTLLELVRIAKPVDVYKYDVAVVGGGPAGLSAAVNLKALFGKSSLIIEKFAPGGAAATAINRIDNYLGFPDGIEAAELAARWKSHADKYQIDWLPGYGVTDVVSAAGEYPFKLTVAQNNKDRGPLNSLADDKQVVAKKVLLACGLNITKQGGTGEGIFEGQGVYYSALPGDAALYDSNSKPVAIIGGGDTAGQAAIMFAQAKIKTIMIIRGKFGDDMLEGNSSQIKALGDYIKVEEKTEVISYNGDNGYLNKLEVGPAPKPPPPGTPIEVAAAYVLVGARGLDKTTKDWLQKLKAEIDDKDGGVKTISPTGQRSSFNMTTAAGVFVAGDARAGSVRRIAEAVGDGGSAALGIYNDFKK